MSSPLGKLSPAQFLRRHWQKRPLHVPAALPELRDAFSAEQLRALACRDDVESRRVSHVRGRWHLEHGPFARHALRHPPAGRWSLLVQGADLHLTQARALLHRFNFIPYARLDDVMLSFAPPGGGVGPHFDSYDVFLLQVRGRRRWRFGAQRDLRLVKDAPLRILREFRPRHDIEVGPGDLLYLPPRYAHDGVALTDCITCSVGFRAPAAKELAGAFLQWLPEKLALAGRYQDPDLVPQAHPARIGSEMVAQLERMLASIRWRRSDVERFVGEYLTEPKASIWFEPPAKPLPLEDFSRSARTRGIRLSPKSRMLYRAQHAFINGEVVVVPAESRVAVRALADQRELIGWRARSIWLARTLHEWYRAGYVELRSR